MVPTQETVRRALDWAREHDFTMFVFLRLAAVTGARRSELIDLQRGDFAAGQVTIRRVCVPGPGGITIVNQTKSESRGKHDFVR